MTDNPQSTAERQISKVFVMREEQIKSVCDLFQDLYKVEPRLRAECIDHIKHEFLNLNDLFTYENSKSSKIQKLRILSDTNHFDLSIDKDSLPGIWYEVSVPREKIHETHKRLEAIIEGTEPWYWHIARIDLWSIGFASLVLAGIVNTMFDIADKAIFEGSSIDYGTAYICLLLIGFPALGYLKEKFFNKSAILIGQAKERYKMDEIIRLSIIIPTFISIVTGTIFLLLGN